MWYIKMDEQSKAIKRRFNDGAFHTRYLVGRGIDIGGGPDPLGQYVRVFPLMLSAQTWDIDKGDGDAQFMYGVKDNTYDFLSSSHCLEHIVNPQEAIYNWIRIVKPGGFLIVTVPDEDMYEGGVFPSRWNDDHKHTFTIYKERSWSPVSINVLDLLIKFSSQIDIERVTLVNDFYRNPEVFKHFQEEFDQTLTPTTECAIEFIVQKKETENEGKEKSTGNTGLSRCT
jgi:SAM-dependent methyltransferase|tara:strand:- start:1823 stop:2503 length:681 start_codon:yes stop_codon:yes gene_type:complete